MCSEQLAEYGFSGLVQAPEVYALKVIVPWDFFPNPGPVHAGTGGTPNAVGQRNADVVFSAKRICCDPKNNVCRVAIKSLNVSVPGQYKRAVGNCTGARIYMSTNEPREIIANLRSIYGRPTTAKKRANEVKFSAPWTPSNPIKELINHPEECYGTATEALPPYTSEQMIDKALMTV